MEPNFHNNQYIIVDQVSPHLRSYKRGDVVVFKYPQNVAFTFIKRVIGLPGETVEIKNHQVHIYNENYPEGAVLAEKYLNNKTDGDMKITLDKNQYFVMGDNRRNSSDSRYWGPLDRHLIIGRVWVVLYPFDQFRTVARPSYGRGL